MTLVWIRSGTIVLTIATFALLFLGISLPCISVSSHLFGFIHLGSESNSIIGVIGKLLQSNFLLGLLITLFSIVISLSKLSLTLYMIISRNSEHNKFITVLVHNIGKWSMVDVFSMSIIVSLLRVC